MNVVELASGADGDCVTVRPVGEHDAATCADLSSAIHVATADGTAVVVDLTDATFVDSTMLAALVRAWRRNRLAIAVHPESPAWRLFEITDLVGVLPLYPTVREASRSLHAPVSTCGVDGGPAAP